jgi:hypothetical protein
MTAAELEKLDTTGDGALLRVLDDPIFAYKALHELTSTQREARGIDDDDFADGFTGDSLGKARDAIAEALANFHPSPVRREAAHALIAKFGEFEREIMKQVNSNIAAVDVSTAVEQAATPERGE